MTRYGSLDAILNEAASSSEGGLVLSKVRRDIDYVKHAVQVVTIPTDLPIPKVDLTRPRVEPDEAVFAVAKASGLEGAVRRLVAALTADRSA